MRITRKQIGNLLGATVLALHDELSSSVESCTGRAGETAAAIVVLGHQPGLSNDHLSKLLKITHTGTVRLIDNLVADALVKRESAKHDKRVIAISLTRKGEKLREKILKTREASMVAASWDLSAEERSSLHSILSKVLVNISTDDEHKLRICRLCDASSCPDCPIFVPT